MPNKPKLILLNGPLAIGKSTLSQRYVDDHPLALNLDFDRVRESIGGWRENRQESFLAAQKMSGELARISIEAGQDVVMPWMIRREDNIEFFKDIADQAGARLCEVTLRADKDDAVKRCVARGFQAGGILDSGGEILIAEMYEQMMEVSKARPDTIWVDSILDDIDGTYRNLIQKVE